MFLITLTGAALVLTLTGAALIIIVLLVLLKRHKQSSYPPLVLVKCLAQRPRIFVAIASYRDPEVLRTVRWLCERACHPGQLRIVVLEQNEPNDVSVSSLNLSQVQLDQSLLSYCLNQTE